MRAVLLGGGDRDRESAPAAASSAASGQVSPASSVTASPLVLVCGTGY